MRTVPIGFVMVIATLLFWNVTTAPSYAQNKMPQSGLDAALLSAVRQNDLSKVQNLLKQGANPNAVDPHATSKSYPQKLSYPSALLVALDWRARQTTEHLIIKDYIPADPPPENLALVAALLKKGANAHVRNEVDCTPLMIVAWQGRSKLVQLLLQYDSNVNIQEKRNQYTALMFAVASGDKETVKVLINAKADIDTIQNKQGTTALSLAKGINKREDTTTIISSLEQGLVQK